MREDEIILTRRLFRNTKFLIKFIIALIGIISIINIYILVIKIASLGHFKDSICIITNSEIYKLPAKTNKYGVFAVYRYDEKYVYYSPEEAGDYISAAELLAEKYFISSQHKCFVRPGDKQIIIENKARQKSNEVIKIIIVSFISLFILCFVLTD